MLSIICASNNKEILDECLRKSLEKQTYTEFELIIVDTKKYKYTGASEALMDGARKAKGKYLMFVHHDVIFENVHELSNIINYIKEINDFGVIGVAGAAYDKDILIGNITNGIPKHHITDFEIEEPTEVQSVDELIFIIKSETIKKYPLNIENKTWHLYAVEYCLLMKNLKEKVFVIPSQLYHVSAGASLNNSYYKQLRNVCKEYKNDMKTINTTVGYWHTNRLLLELEIIKHKLIYKIVTLVRNIKSKWKYKEI